MKGFPAELIYVLIVAGIVLFQYVMKRLRPQAQQESVQNEPLAQIPEEVKETPAASSVSHASAGLLGRPEAPGVSSRLTRPRYSRGSLMGARRDVQNAIVIATILGPCRAYEPHDVR